MKMSAVDHLTVSSLEGINKEQIILTTKAKVKDGAGLEKNCEALEKQEGDIMFWKVQLCNPQILDFDRF